MSKPALIDLIAAFLKSSLTLLMSSKLISKGVGVSAFTAIALGPIVCHFFSLPSFVSIGLAPSHGLKKLAFLPACANCIPLLQLCSLKILVIFFNPSI